MKAILIVLILSFSAYSHASVLATVGKEKITVQDFNKKLSDVKKNAPLNSPTTEQFLEDLIRFEIGVQEAEKLNLRNDPMVKERVKQAMYGVLLEKKLGAKIEAIKITENDLKSYYKKNPELHLAHILIDVKPNATAQERDVAKRRALEILTEVKNSKRDFPELVKLYSDDIVTKDFGGDIGFQSRATLSAEIYDFAKSMRENETRGLVETQFGFHILKLIDRRSYDQADKRQIRLALFDARRAQIFNSYFEKLKRNYKINIDQQVLKSVKN